MRADICTIDLQKASRRARIKGMDTTAEDHCREETRYSVTSRITLSPAETLQAQARHQACGDRPGRPKAWPKPVPLADALARRGTPAGMDADVWEMLRNRP